MSEVAIGRATSADIPGLVSMAAGLFAEDAGRRDKTTDASWPAQHGAQRFSETISDPARLVLAARAAGQVVGSLSAFVEPATAMRPIPVAVLASLYVHPGYRESGVGAQLVAHFRAWAQSMDAARIAVTAYTTNRAAIAFYERAGFLPYTLTLEADLGS